MRSVVLVLVSTVLFGCSGATKQLEQEMASLRSRVDGMARSTSAFRNRVENVENRVLLLQDEVETQKVAAIRGGIRPIAPVELPTVTLEPRREEERSYGGEHFDTGEFLRGSEASSRSVYQELDDEGRLVSGSTRKRSTPARAAEKPRKIPKPKKKRQSSSADPEPLREYRSAYEIYQQGRIGEAIQRFKEFVERYPRHAHADNAQYWIGECLYDQRDFEGAKREFMLVVTEHPNGNKVPDAMVKVGLCGKNMGQNEEARRMFHTVMLTYPDTDAAAVAMRLTGELP